MNKKKNFIKVVLFSVIVFSISSCKQLLEMQNLAKCEFRLNSVKVLSVDGIDFSGVKSINDLNVLSMVKLGNSFKSGKLPISYTANIEAKNPHSQKASINKLFVQVLFNDVDLVQTEVNKRVEIMPNQTSLIPLNLTSDIAHIMKGENIKSILDLLFSPNDSKAVFTIKIKPSVLVAGITINYPGYITLTKDFKSN